MSNERISTGSLGERLMLRTRSTRGSVRETLSKAIRSTLGRSSSVEKKSTISCPKFGTALTAMTSRTPSSEERSSESGEGDSPKPRKFSNKDCARIYFSNTSSEQSSRSNSSTPRRVRQTTLSSGFGSLSHLPPIQRKSLDPLNSIMSQSMYVQSPGAFHDDRHSFSPRRRHQCEDSSETWIPSSPSLTTLKDFLMTNEDDMFEEDFDFDVDDGKSVISSASTSRLFSVDRRMSKYQKNQTLRQFLNSPVRLRKRDSSRRDAVEAGFEPREAVPRCHSTQSLRDVQRVKAYSNSQFQASDLSLNPNGRVLAPCDSTSGNVAPMAVVNPAQMNRHHHINQHHHSSYEKDIAHHDIDRRRSLQTLTGASSLYQMTNGGGVPNGRSQFSPSDLAVNNPAVHHHVGSRVRVSSVNQLCDSSSTPQFSIDQRRSVHNIGQPVRNSFVEGIKTTSTPKNQIAVAPLAHKSRHLSESRDEMRSERRGSAGGPINLPAYSNYLVRHSGEERLVDGPIDSASDARIAYLEKRIRELEMSQKDHSLQSTPNQSRYSKSSHLNGSSLSTSEQLRLQEMSDELVTKDRKVTSLESKLLKAYQRIEKINEDYDSKIKTLMYDGENARDNLSRCVNKIQLLENELEVTRAAAQSGDNTNDQEYHELRDKIWKQERELQETRTMLTRLREKEAEYERMRSEKGYLELKNENLNKKLEAKKRAVEELERSVSTMRLEQTICQQSCSSGSTPLADEIETMSDIRPSLARPYAKAHSTMGSHMSPLSHSKSNGLTKSVSSFGLNSAKRDDITPMMSRTIREQNRHLTDCRAMVVVLKNTIERLARGDNVDAAALLGVKMNMLSESEMDEDEDEEAAESKPFSMMAAESALSKQCAKMVELDKDLDWIRLKLADWHGQTNMEGEGDRDACRVQ